MGFVLSLVGFVLFCHRYVKCNISINQIQNSRNVWDKKGTKNVFLPTGEGKTD